MAGSVIKEFNKHCKNVLFEITKKFEGVDYKRLELEYDFEKKSLLQQAPLSRGLITMKLCGRVIQIQSIFLISFMKDRSICCFAMMSTR